MKNIKIQKLSENAIIPKYQTEGAAGFDFHSAESIILLPQETKIIKTDLSFEIPKGFELQIRCRSSIAVKTPLIIKNSPGTIDSDYRGNIGIIVHNLSSKPYLIEQGDRIAQGIISKYERATFIESSELTKTSRGKGGFGHTGNK